jgi:FkbM family methyltransferase
LRVLEERALTTALSYTPNTEKLRTALRFRDKFFLLFDLIVLFVCYPLYHTKFLRSIPPILYRILKDYRVEVHGIIFVMPGNCPIENTLINEDYEPEVRQVIAGFRKGVFVDGGGGVGLYTLMASKLMGENGQVITLEPDPMMFSRLKQSLDVNACKNVKLYKLAAWSSATTMKFYDNPLVRFGSSLLKDSKPKGYRATHFDVVQTVELDNLIPEGSPLLMKLDIEGAEAEAMKGAIKNLMRDDVQVIFEALSPEALRKSKEVLEPLGYSVARLSEQGREEENDFIAVKRGRNFMAVKE